MKQIFIYANYTSGAENRESLDFVFSLTVGLAAFFLSDKVATDFLAESPAAGVDGAFLLRVWKIITEHVGKGT